MQSLVMELLPEPLQTGNFVYSLSLLSGVANSISVNVQKMHYWGEPERAPHLMMCTAFSACLRACARARPGWEREQLYETRWERVSTAGNNLDASTSTSSHENYCDVLDRVGSSTPISFPSLEVSS